jgi:hypothetical protein
VPPPGNCLPGRCFAEAAETWAQASEGVKKSCCHAERSEASAFIRSKTKKCRFLATLGMTGPADFFTPSQHVGRNPPGRGTARGRAAVQPSFGDATRAGLRTPSSLPKNAGISRNASMRNNEVINDAFCNVFSLRGASSCLPCGQMVPAKLHKTQEVVGYYPRFPCAMRNAARMSTALPVSIRPNAALVACLHSANNTPQAFEVRMINATKTGQPKLFPRGPKAKALRP